MNTHTPGPWEINKEDTGMNDSGTIEASGIVIVPDVYGRSKGEADANARLIEAAPDLLLALVDLYTQCAMTHKYWGEGCNNKEATRAIANGLKAIAKAKGQEVPA